MVANVLLSLTFGDFPTVVTSHKRPCQLSSNLMKTSSFSGDLTPEISPVTSLRWPATRGFLRIFLPGDLPPESFSGNLSSETSSGNLPPMSIPRRWKGGGTVSIFFCFFFYDFPNSYFTSTLLYFEHFGSLKESPKPPQVETAVLNISRMKDLDLISKINYIWRKRCLLSYRTADCI